MNGNNGNDYLSGSPNNDVLNATSGNDIMTGGPCGEGVETIVDFETALDVKSANCEDF